MIKRMKTACAVISLLALSLTAFGGNFRPGKVITLDRDTLDGFIDFSTNKNNGMVCRFKLVENDKEQVFLPNDISSYAFTNEGKHYISREVEIDSKKQTVFLEFLVQGVMNLYYYKDPNNTRMEYYFFEDKDGNVTQITKKPNKFNGKIDVVDNKYRSQLSYLFREFPEMSERLMLEANKENDLSVQTKFEKWKEFSYDRSNMIDLVKTYHQKACTTGDDCIVFENNASRRYVRLQFLAYAGLQWTTFDWNLAQLESFDALFPVIGVRLNISDPRFSQSMSIYVDGSISKFKGENKFNIVNGANNSQYTNKLSSFTTSWKVGLQYTYPKGKFRPSISAGYGIQALFSTSNTLHILEEKDGDIITKKMSDYYTTPSLFHGFNAGIGCEYMVNKQAIFVGASYDDTKGKASGQSKGTMKLKFIQFKVGYRF